MMARTFHISIDKAHLQRYNGDIRKLTEESRLASA